MISPWFRPRSGKNTPMMSLPFHSPTSKHTRAVFLAFILPILMGLNDAWGLLQGETAFNVRQLGAVGDGMAKDTAAVQKAIDACAAAGGGTVFFPAGTYLCGSLHLQSRLALYLDAGAIIKASPDEADFDPYETLGYHTDSDRETTYFHYSLLWGENLHRVSILGPGTIDGNRSRRGGPKPIALKRCQDILIRDISILNAPNYCVSLLGCDYVNLDGITIRNAYCDGIDPDACRYVRIADCHIESWDDAIVLKSSFALGERRATEFVTVTNCVLSTSCNAFKMGTESGGGFRHVTASNLVMFSPPGKRPMISGIALESVDGAEVDNITITGVSMRDVRTPIFLRLGNRGRDMETPIPGTLRNIIISDVAGGAATACSITGIPGHPVENVSLNQVMIEYQGGGAPGTAERAIPELPDEYPDADMFGELPAYGLYVRHVQGLTLRDTRWTFAQPDARPVSLFEDVEDLRVTGLAGQSTGRNPFMIWRDVRGAFLESTSAPAGTGTYLQVAGEKSQNLRILNSDLREANHAVRTAPEVQAGALFETGNQHPQEMK